MVDSGKMRWWLICVMYCLASLPLKFLTMLHGDAGIQPGGPEAFSLLWLFIVFTAVLENFYVKECILQTKNFSLELGPKNQGLICFNLFFFKRQLSVPFAAC